MPAKIHQLQSTLNRLKTRKRLQNLMDTLTLCAIFLEIFTIFVVLCYGVKTINFSTLPALLSFAVVAVLIFGTFFWQSIQSDPRSLAECVDLHYGLKDRLLVAALILARPEPTPMERLQLSDAALHARQVDPGEVLPVRWPRNFRLFCSLSIVLFTVTLLVASSDSSASRPTNRINEIKEILVTFSQMEQALTQAKQALSSEAMEVSLAEIGDALVQPEREITGRMLQEIAEKIKERNLPQLSQLTEQLAEEILHGNLEAIQEAVSELATMVNLHRETHRQLEGKLALLEEQKADIITALNGGQGTEPSKTPSQSWGTGEAGDPLTGPATQLDTIRQPHQLPGLQGDGPSDVETIISLEGTEETAERPYVEVYRQAFQAAETALETEPIPLRHRQVIRQYFEAVKPMK